MTETAVGLFEHAGAAQEVVEALRQKGFPATGIRVVSAPSGVSAHSTGEDASSDFNMTVTRAFKGIGASDQEASAYLSRLHAGNALVYATGTTEQARVATEVMNDFYAIEIDEFEGAGVGAGSRTGDSHAVVSADSTPGVAEPSSEGSATRSDPNTTAKIEHHRKRTEGARVFAW